MKFESELWESFLDITEGVFVIAGTILTIAKLLEGSHTDDHNFIDVEWE